MELDTLLADLPEKYLFQRPGASESAIAALEREYALQLPADYRHLLLRSDGGSIGGRVTAINYESIDVLMWHNRDSRFVKDLARMFVIGDDGGGAVYFYDPTGHLGRGAWSLLIIPLAELGSDRYRFAGQTLTIAVRRVIEGESFFD